MKGPEPLKPLTGNGLRIACELTQLAYQLKPWKLQPGVRKFHSVEEMSRHRREREKAWIQTGRVAEAAT